VHAEGQEIARVAAPSRRLLPDRQWSIRWPSAAAHRRSLCVLVAARLRSSVLRWWCTWMLPCSLRLIAPDPPLPLPPLLSLLNPLLALAAASSTSPTPRLGARRSSTSRTRTSCQSHRRTDDHTQSDMSSDGWTDCRMEIECGREDGTRATAALQPIPIPHPHQPLHARGSRRQLSARSRRSTMQLSDCGARIAAAKPVCRTALCLRIRPPIRSRDSPLSSGCWMHYPNRASAPCSTPLRPSGPVMRAC